MLQSWLSVCGHEMGEGMYEGWMPLPTHPQQYCDPASLVDSFGCQSIFLTWLLSVCLSVCLSIYQSVILSFNSIPIFTYSLSLLLFAISFLLQDVLSFCVDTLVTFCIIMIRNGQIGNTGTRHNQKKTASPLRSVIAGLHCSWGVVKVESHWPDLGYFQWFLAENGKHHFMGLLRRSAEIRITGNDSRWILARNNKFQRPNELKYMLPNSNQYKSSWGCEN